MQNNNPFKQELDEKKMKESYGRQKVTRTPYAGKEKRIVSVGCLDPVKFDKTTIYVFLEKLEDGSIRAIAKSDTEFKSEYYSPSGANNIIPSRRATNMRMGLVNKVSIATPYNAFVRMLVEQNGAIVQSRSLDEEFYLIDRIQGSRSSLEEIFKRLPKTEETR